MTAVATFTTSYGTHPYLTVDEYRAAPTSIDTMNLVPTGVDADQDVALANLILRASSWMDSFCNQFLAASLDIEATRARCDRMGMLHLHPKNWPILEVRDVEWGGLPNQLFGSADLTTVWIEEQQIHVPLGGARTSFFGSFDFSPVMAPGQLLFVRLSYVNGWPDTVTTTAPGNAGATTLVVKDPIGIYGGVDPTATQTVPGGTRLTVFDGGETESVEVQSVSGSTLTLSAPTAFAHPSNVSVSALPAAAKQACVLLTSALVKTRGSESFVMQQVNQIGSLQSIDPVGRADLLQAFDLLRPFRRIR